MTIPRKQQVNLNDTVYYHCMSRCVRRAFLYGFDSTTERNYDHRKAWFIDHLKSLCSIFAIKVCSYGIMSNHYHLVLCVEPDVVAKLSDEEVISRVKHIPTLRMHGTFAKPKKVEKIYTPEEIKNSREKLSNISNFMGALNEFIARKANKEDDCTGHFWEGRFKSTALLDDTALLTCMAYVDLNPMRAGMADLLETSDFTSIQERLRILNKIPMDKNNPGLKNHLGVFAEKGSLQKTHIPSTFEAYHQLVQWTADYMKNKTTPLKPEICNLLDSFAINTQSWLNTTQEFEKRYSWAAGSFQRLKSLLKQKGFHWVRGMKNIISVPINR